ncbi:zinc finger protein 235-like isoform X1 [Anopheles darlingi]|uniref:zinc finger protein 235-like isoform X1 n=1 Tax=Anopheles darlingi TaxID=43151 RepID=UPI002100230B|nr:zinc finger protein 235-like isoform X1 [Anopheles darlingi]XP_049545148.1 zinc finger protein 235-like isoform X1 [Anopheles darlingi]
MLKTFCRICLTATGVEYSIDEAIDGTKSLYTVVCRLCPEAFPDKSSEWSRHVCEHCRQRILNAQELYDLCKISIECFEELYPKGKSSKPNVSEIDAEEDHCESYPDMNGIDVLEEDAEIVRSFLGLNRAISAAPSYELSMEETNCSEPDWMVSIAEDPFTIEPSHDQDESFDSCIDEEHKTQDNRSVTAANGNVDLPDANFATDYQSSSQDAFKMQEDGHYGEIVLSTKSHGNGMFNDLIDSIIYATVFNDEVSVLHKEKLRCTFCEDEVFSSQIILNNHLKELHSDKIFICNPCDRVFVDEETYNTHEKYHSLDRCCFCTICEKGFEIPRSLREHIAINHASQEHSCICPSCGVKMDDYTKLESHIKSHEEVKSFYCNLCPLRFHKEVRLKEHLKRHENEENFPCEVCGQRLSTRRNLKNHQRLKHTVRTGEKPFGCDVCGKRFESKQRSQKHMITHTGERPYACMFCDRRYGDVGDLKSHLRKHLGDNIYQCDRCDASFRLKKELKRHYAVHFQGNDADNPTSGGNSDFRFTLEYIVNLRRQKELSKLHVEENHSSVE